MAHFLEMSKHFICRVNFLRLQAVNLHQRGQLLCSVRVPQVDPPAGAAEGGGGQQRSVRGEVAGGQEVQGLMGPSGQVPHEGVRAQAPQTHHLMRGGWFRLDQKGYVSQCE